MPKIFAPVRSSGSGDPGGVTTLWSKDCWKISPENFPATGCFDGGCGSRELCDDCNTTGVRHNRWMGRHN